MGGYWGIVSRLLIPIRLACPCFQIVGTTQRKVSREKQRGLRVREGRSPRLSSSFFQRFFFPPLSIDCSLRKQPFLLLATRRLGRFSWLNVLIGEERGETAVFTGYPFRTLYRLNDLQQAANRQYASMLRALFWFAARYQHCSSRGWITPVFQGGAVCCWTWVSRCPSRTCLL